MLFRSGDTYGSSTSTVSKCDQPTGYVTNSTDCNDGAKKAYPGATEYCDGIQNDCNTAWTSASEYGKVTSIDGATGAYSALTWSTVNTTTTTQQLTGGTSSKPNTINVCQANAGTNTYYVRLQATASAYYNIIGINRTTLTKIGRAHV